MSVSTGLYAGTVGAVVGGVPSTAYALVSRGDPLDATAAAGTLLLPRESRRGRLLAAGLVAHAGISLGWGVVLAHLLPGRRPVVEGVLAGLAVAALDLGGPGRSLPRIRALPLGPQLADHLVYGVAVALVSAGRGVPGAGARGWCRPRRSRWRPAGR